MDTELFNRLYTFDFRGVDMYVDNEAKAVLLKWCKAKNAVFDDFIVKGENIVRQIFDKATPQNPRVSPPFFDKNRLQTLLTHFLDGYLKLAFKNAEDIVKNDFRIPQIRDLEWYRVNDVINTLTLEIIAHTEEKFWYWYTKGKLTDVYTWLREHYFKEVRAKRIAVSTFMLGANWFLFENAIGWFESKVWTAPDLQGKSEFLHGMVRPILAPFLSPEPEKYPSVLFPPLHPLDRSLVFFV